MPKEKIMPKFTDRFKLAFRKHVPELKNIFPNKSAPEWYSEMPNIEFGEEASSGYNELAKESYVKNVIAFRAINLVTQAAASVPWLLYKRGRSGKKIEVENHSLHNLLKRPNLINGGAEFFEALYSYKIISGNAYIKATRGSDQEPLELHLLRPDRVSIVASKTAIPKGYKYGEKGGRKFYPIDPITGKSDVLHLRNFSPLEDYYGLSSVEAAAYPLDLHNESAKWASTILRNGARPTGAFVYKNECGLSDREFEILKEQIHSAYCGSKNAGKPFVLQDGLEWQSINMSAKDMDFVESMNGAARNIALAFGVPPQLLGIQGDNTYSNYQEARLALWEETVLPLLDHTTDALNSWLVPMFGDNLGLGYDLDEVNALTSRREKTWKRIEGASFLTINEKRELLGFTPIEGGDKI
jgi:HK97 family phage portal protein